MKTFNDLVFETHPMPIHFKQQARLDFDNGYGVSVINGFGAYCDDDTYEVAIFKNGELCYDTHITDDVLSYQSIEDINRVLIQVSEL